MSQNYDRRLQRALNYEDNDSVTKLREQIENLDQMVERFQVQWSNDVIPHHGCSRAFR